MTPGSPKVTQGCRKVTQGCPLGHPRVPQGCPKGAPRVPQGRPRSPKGHPRSPFWSPRVTKRHPKSSILHLFGMLGHTFAPEPPFYRCYISKKIYVYTYIYIYIYIYMYVSRVQKVRETIGFVFRVHIRIILSKRRHCKPAYQSSSSRLDIFLVFLGILLCPRLDFVDLYIYI